jgi:[ribosomal protein S5]-alanine N-acetyltransferase
VTSGSPPLRGRPHPAGSGSRLYGRRVVLRPLVPQDFPAWSEVRRRNARWLLPWEPRRPAGHPDPAVDREAFNTRCSTRDRERQLGVAYAYGIFVDQAFAGEINLSGVTRGAVQGATVGYWIDEARAGRSYMPESVVVVARHAFENLGLHRLEICIIPRNDRSRRVVEKLGVRCEGLAERLLEIDGRWEDHLRFAITAEEWDERRDELVEVWL